MDTFGDILANCAKRHVRKAFCAVAVIASVGSAMWSSIVNGPSDGLVSVLENGNKLVDWLR